jgi:hypothetical protein
LYKKGPYFNKKERAYIVLNINSNQNEQSLISVH